MTLEILHPWMFLLTATVPLVWWVSLRTLTDFSRAQRCVMTALRSLIVLLLVLALVGVTATRRSHRTAVVLAVDVSQSVSDEALALSDALARDLWRDAHGPVLVVTFDNEPRLVGLPDDPARPLITRSAAPPVTDVASALRFARAALPAGHVGRVVLLSDGRETTGDMLDEAASLSARGVELCVAALPAAPGPEVIAAGLDLPQSATPGGTAEVVARLLSSHEAAASLELFVDGFRLGGPREVALSPGENKITSAVRLPKGGSHEYTVRVTSASDTFEGNNEASAVVTLPAELKVLVVEGREDDAKFLARALRDAGLTVDVRTASGFPTDLIDLDRYACVVLSDVAATAILPGQMRMLKTYVEDLGGGFVMVGGEDSFGLGGYFRTPVEQILPVRLDIEKRKEEPTLAMMLVLDKSGSMQGKKVQLAKEASLSTLELLGSEDMVGVVSFDTQGYLVVGLSRATDRGRISSTLAGIVAGGGTNMYPALELAHRELRLSKARVKHVILLTDGKTHDGAYSELTRRMARDRITVSCVAVGGEADVALLQNVARWGRGRFYYTRDALSIPQIFARETVTASRSAVVEEPFRPRVVRDVEVIRGVDFNEAPYLLGYVSTKPKPTSEVILVTERAEPLLVRWRRGLGKTAAFTSDVKNRWSAQWLSWPHFTKFWAQLIRDTMRTTPPGAFDLVLSFDDKWGEVSLDAVDVAGRFRNRLRVETALVTPDGRAARLALEQRGPGRYGGRFRAPLPGSYVVSAWVHLPGDEHGAPEVVVAAGSKPHPAEYASLEVNRKGLRRLATLAGGEFIDSDEWAGSEKDVAALAKRLAEPSQKHVSVRKPLWPDFLWAALGLFFLDLVSRRIDFRTRPRRTRPGGAA